MKKLLAILAAVLLASCGTISDVRQGVHQVTDGTGYCSAVVLAPGVILTASHCVEPAAGSLMLKPSDEKSILIAQGDDILDLALLRVPVTCPCVEFADSEAQIDEPVYVVGYPFSLTQVVSLGVSQGIVDDISLSGPWGTTEELGRRLVIAGYSAPGNSGGGVFVRRGGRFLLVGIMTEGKGPIAFAVPLSTIKPFMEKHL